MEIAEFLLARIAEDERRFDLPEYDVVLNSHGEVSARGDGWVTRGDCPICGAYQFDGTEAVTEEAWWDHAEKVHQRARVLAECEAKRRIVELCKEAESIAGTYEWWRRWPVLCALARVYAEHPDFDPDWKA